MGAASSLFLLGNAEWDPPTRVHIMGGKYMLLPSFQSVVTEKRILRWGEAMHSLGTEAFSWGTAEALFQDTLLRRMSDIL